MQFADRVSRGEIPDESAARTRSPSAVSPGRRADAGEAVRWSPGSAELVQRCEPDAATISLFGSTAAGRVVRGHGFVPGDMTPHADATVTSRITQASPVVVQRKLGAVGDAARHRPIGREGETVARWTCTNVRQTTSGAWEYELTPKLFGMTKWVGADEPYDFVDVVVPKPLTTDQLAVRAEIQARLAANVSVDVTSWIGVESQGEFAAIAAAPSRTGGTITFVWSGGASDCIIVAGVGAGKAALTHLDRTSDPGDIAPLVKGRTVVLASEKFTLPLDESARDEVVMRVIQRLGRDRIAIGAIYPAKQLAVHQDGRIGSTFDLDALKSGVSKDLPSYG